ncbi:MAG: hypothetical protein HQ553_03565 [Chloroflexi bacterium]|nr:hypothetical protein [Chloroflexota bacterium]
MPEAAFLVDGHLEQKFIKRACPRKRVQRINCNGRDVAILAIAVRIASQCRLWKGKYRPIIVILDREGRSETSTNIAEQLLAELRSLDVTDEIKIGVADRMIENWILADHKMLCQVHQKRAEYPVCVDGFNGKSVIRICVSGYHEATVGVELLIGCTASEIRKNSPSFAEFSDQLPSDDCWWLCR